MVERRGPGGGQYERPRSPDDPAVHRERFEELAGAFNTGEFNRRNEDGSVTTVVSYERHIDPLDRGDLALMSEFRLRAAGAGLREAFSPLILPTQAVIDPTHTEAITGDYYLHRPLTVVQLGYEKPAAIKPPGPPAPQSRGTSAK